MRLWTPDRTFPYSVHKWEFFMQKKSCFVYIFLQYVMNKLLIPTESSRLILLDEAFEFETFL